jgi:hypothetical protein
MKAQKLTFNHIVEILYNLSLEEKLEIRTLLERNIADTRRKGIADNYKQSLKELTSGKLKFDSTIDEAHQALVMECFEEIRNNPEKLLDWDEAKKSLRTE